MKFLSALLLAGLAAGKPTQEPQDEEYEYVIVGSGPGGGTLAANLAREGHSVFLLEAGADGVDDPMPQVPAFSQRSSEDPRYAWRFFINHYQDDTQALRDPKYTYMLGNGSYYVGLDPPSDAEPLGIYYPRGASLGGSGQVNALNWAWAPDHDWDAIAELTGDESWRASSMRQHLMNLENCTYVPEGTPGHGFEGVIQNAQNDPRWVTSRPGLAQIAKTAIAELEGIEVQSDEELAELLTRDLNRLDADRYKPSLVPFPLSRTTSGRRNGAATFVKDVVAAGHPLTVSTNSLVTKILFENGGGGDKPRAYGVEYLKGESLYAADPRYDASKEGEVKTVTASKEVIVAGGTFNTPQILKLSGVGPREELESLGIEVVADLPAVGNYLQDNFEGGVWVDAAVDFENPPFANCTFDLDSSQDICYTEWLSTGGGPYARAGAALSINFRSSVSETADSDLMIFGDAQGVFRGFWPGYSEARYPASAAFWSVVKMQTGDAPGTVTLRSANPRDVPAIDFNWFSGPNAERDLQAISEGIEFVLGVYNRTGSPYAPFTINEPNPNLELKQAIRDEAYSHHVTSTCRMGPAGHPDYCVDSKFRVNGVEGLRVVDASIFPRSPGAMPAGPTYTISQKAFEVIMSEL